MKEHNCLKNLEYSYTIDEVKPFGDIVSIAVFECKICGKEFTEMELYQNKVSIKEV